MVFGCWTINSAEIERPRINKKTVIPTSSASVDCVVCVVVASDSETRIAAPQLPHSSLQLTESSHSVGALVTQFHLTNKAAGRRAGAGRPHRCLQPGPPPGAPHPAAPAVSLLLYQHPCRHPVHSLPTDLGGRSVTLGPNNS